MKNFPYYLVLVLCFNAYMLHGQPTFKNETFNWWGSKPPRSPIAGAIVDINGDFFDDIVALDQGMTVKYYQYTDRKLELLSEKMVSNTVQWTMAAGDFDNTGTNAIVTAGVYNGVTITTLKDNALLNTVLPAAIYAQGANTIDVDNDGRLDVFLCHDEGYPIFYMNKEDGFSIENIIDFKANDNSDGSGNYGAEWTDINNDGLPDLYISKCRAGVTDPTDHRRINKLFVNKGNTTFEESAAKYNIANGSQSWATAFGDLDNDGDNDAIVVNHENPHVLYENLDGNACVPIPTEKEIATFGFQALMRDLDNDGYLDILISGIGGLVLYHNRGDMTFTIYEKFLNPSRMLSMNAGDINDDGLIDIYGHISEPINNVGYLDDEIWINTSIGNNFVKFNLIGTASNSNAVGAKLEIFGAFGYQQRIVKGGESYGIVNSFQQHFGLGQHDIIDSLIIHWPSGINQKFTDISANDTYVIEETGCITAQSIRGSEVIFVSEQNPATISATDAPMASYLWNTQDTTSAIIISKPGKYTVKMRDTNGCLYVSKPIIAKDQCLDPNIDLIKDKSITVCSGDDIVITPPAGKDYLWSDGSVNNVLSITQSGIYALTITDYCGAVFSDTFTITLFKPEVTYTGDTITSGNPATLTATNPNTYWYAAADQSKLLHSGSTFITQALDSSQYFYATSFQDVTTNSGRMGINTFPAGNQYSANAIEGNMIFNTFEKCTISSVKVGTDTPGTRRIIIRDKAGAIVFSKDFFIDSGFSELTLDATIATSGEYRIGTATDVNISNFGYKSPRLMRTQGGTDYPYHLDDAMLLFSSDGGPFYYYYFYDWKVEYDYITCSSPLDSVYVLVEKPDETTEQTQPIASVYPNPARDHIYIECAPNFVQFRCFDANGRCIAESDDNRFDASSWLPGVYMIAMLTREGKMAYIKCIKSP